MLKIPDDLMEEFHRLQEEGKFEIAIVGEKEIPETNEVDLEIDLNPESKAFLEKLCERLGITLNQFFETAFKEAAEKLKNDPEFADQLKG